MPGQKLTVAGNVTIEGANNGVIFPDGTTLTTAAVAPAAAVVNPQQVALLRWYAANQSGINFGVGANPNAVAFDGANIWVANGSNNTVSKL